MPIDSIPIGGDTIPEDFNYLPVCPLTLLTLVLVLCERQSPTPLLSTRFALSPMTLSRAAPVIFQRFEKKVSF